jgi:hypothetical protein
VRVAVAISIGAAALALGVACTAFSGDSSDGEGGPDGAAEAARDDGSLPACAELTPGEGPPPLHPEAGPPESDCSGARVDLETSAANCGTCGVRCDGIPCVYGACASEAVYTGGDGLGIRYARGDRLVISTASDALEIAPDGGVLRTIGSLDGGNGAFVTPDDEADWFGQQGSRADRVEPDGAVSASISLSGITPMTFVATPDDLAYATPVGGGHDTIQIMGLTKGTGASHPITGKEPFATALVRDGTFLMWAREPILVAGSGTAGQIVRRDLASGDTQRSAPLGVSGALGYDADFVYFFEGVTKELRRLPKRALNGSAGERLATWAGPETFAAAIGAFGDDVYALLTGGGANGGVIARVHRCGSEPIVVARHNNQNLVGAPVVADGKLLFTRYKRIERTQP